MKKIYSLLITFFLLCVGANAQYKVLLNFDSANGANPWGSLVFSPTLDSLYGMTNYGGIHDGGALFSIDTNGNNYNLVSSFGYTDNGQPNGGFTIGDMTIIGNKLYGMSLFGGAYGEGNVFSMNKDGSGYKDMVDFLDADGSEPWGSLTLCGGKLYGMTQMGGAYDLGVIFSIDTNASGFKVIFNFTGSNDGSYPYGSLILIGHKLYGMTSEASGAGYGSIFSIDTSGNNFTQLSQFYNGIIGSDPWGTLMFSGNKLYGLTRGGGPYNYGAIFSIDTDGTNPKTLYNFQVYPNKGEDPFGSLVLSGYVLYGMTYSGGANSDGVLFSIDTNGTGYTDLLDFNTVSGNSPHGSLVRSGNNFYGMTYSGGANNKGVVFEYTDTIFRVMATDSNATCIGAYNGHATANILGGTPPYTYKWLPSGGTYDTAMGLSARVYTITVNDSRGRSASNTVSITQPANIRVSASRVANVSCVGSSNGSAIAIPSGGVPPYTYSWSNGSSTVSTSNPSGALLSAGTYTVSVTDVCSDTPATASVSIGNPPSFSVVAYVNSGVTCHGNSNGSAYAWVNGGTTPYTYLWTPSGQSSALDSDLSAGIYTVTCTDSCGNSATSSVYIPQPSTYLTVSISKFNVSCNGFINGSATASPSGGVTPYTYLWNNGQTYMGAYSLSAGVYTVDVTDSSNCSVTASVTITQPTVLSATTSVLSKVTCNGYNNGEAECTPTGGTTPYTYLWYYSNSTTSTISNIGAGTWTVVLTDNKGCSISPTVTLTQPPLFTGNLRTYTNSGLCTYSMADEQTGGIPPYTYFWNPGGQTTDSIYNQCATNYTLTVTDAYGCYQVDFVSLSCTNYYNQPICIVTIDTATNKSEVIWGRTNSPPAGGYGSYNIYKDTGSGIYALIHNQSLDSLSEFIDNSSDPSEAAQSYEIATIDSCGESELSAPQTSILLTTTQSTNAYSLSWTPYIGFTPLRYRIFRGPSMSTLTQIDSVANTVFTYTDSFPPPNVYYVLEAVNPSGSCIPSTHHRYVHNVPLLSGSFSNGFNTAILGVNNIGNAFNKIKVYPNPTNGTFTLALQNINEPMQVEIYNVLGEKIFNKQFSTFNSQLSIDLSNQPDGVYLYRVILESGEMIGEGKLIIQH